MSYPVFTVFAGDVLPILFSSFAGATGASVTLTGLAVTDIEIYKDGSVTQRASDNGYTLLDTDGIDFDGITGIHGFSIDTGDNSDAGFYTVGAWFTVVVSSVTVDSQTVNFIAAQFRLVPAEAIAGKPKVDVDAWLGTAASTPTVAGVPNVNAKTWNDLTTVALPLVPTTAGRTLDVSAGGEAGVDWANVGTAGSTVNLSATTVKTLTDAPADSSGVTTLLSRLSAARATKLDAISVRDGTAQAGAAGSITLDASASATDTIYKDLWVVIESGTGIGQVRLITGYTGASKVATVSPNWTTTPDNTSVFAVVPAGKVTGVTLADTLTTYTGNTVQTGDSYAIVNSGTFGNSALKTLIDTVDNFVDTEVAAILAAVDTEVAAILALLDDPRTEPGQGAPAVNPDLATKVDYLYKFARNKVTQTSTTLSIFADDAATVDHKATASDDGTTYTRGELASGP